MNDQVTKAKELFDQGKSLSDIAADLGVSSGTVRSWKSRYGWGSNAATQRNVANATQRAQQKPKPDKKAEALAEPLTEKERLFCEIYVRNFNATQAYLKAGFSADSARQNGYRLLTFDYIRGYVEYLKAQKKAAIMAGEDDLVERYMRIAFADMTDFVDFGVVMQPVIIDGSVIMSKEVDPITGKQMPLMQAANSMQFKDSRDIDGGLICEISTSKQGAKIKLEDRQKALDWLARYFEINPVDRHKRDYDNKRLELDERTLVLQENKSPPPPDDIDDDNLYSAIAKAVGK